MRFMAIVLANDESEAGRPPDPRLMEAVEKHRDEMVRAGHVIQTGGLAPTSQGTRLLASGGKLTQVDGPFAEAKELVGGFAILQAKSKEEAIELGRRFMKVHIDVMGPSYKGTLEIRQLFGPEEYCK